MEDNYPQFPWLELIDRPTFCVKDGFVFAINAAAEKHHIQIGMSIENIAVPKTINANKISAIPKILCALPLFNVSLSKSVPP